MFLLISYDYQTGYQIVTYATIEKNYLRIPKKCIILKVP